MRKAVFILLSCLGAIICCSQDKNTKDIKMFEKNEILRDNLTGDTLYLNCGNFLKYYVENEDSLFYPTFRVNGDGDIFKGKQKGEVTANPTGEKYSLIINQKNTERELSFENNFIVLNPPKPKIEVFINEIKWNSSQKLDLSNLVSIKLKAKPDSIFKSKFPKDARYRVVKWKIDCIKKSKTIFSKSFTSQKIFTEDLMDIIEKSDRIMIKVEEVKRLNYRGKTEYVNVGLVLFNIPIKK